MFGAIAKPQGSLGAHRVPSSSLPSLSMRRRVGGRWPPNAVATTSTSRSPLPPSMAVELWAPLQERPGETPSSPVRGVLRAFPSRRLGAGEAPAPRRPLLLAALPSLATCLMSAFLPLLPFFFSSSSGPRSLFFSLLLPPFNKSMLSNTYYVLLHEQEDRRTCPHALPWELSI